MYLKKYFLYSQNSFIKIMFSLLNDIIVNNIGISESKIKYLFYIRSTYFNHWNWCRSEILMFENFDSLCLMYKIIIYLRLTTPLNCYYVDNFVLNFMVDVGKVSQSASLLFHTWKKISKSAIPNVQFALWKSKIE